MEPKEDIHSGPVRDHGGQPEVEAVRSERGRRIAHTQCKDVINWVFLTLMICAHLSWLESHILNLMRFSGVHLTCFLYMSFLQTHKKLQTSCVSLVFCVWVANNTFCTILLSLTQALWLNGEHPYLVCFSSSPLTSRPSQGHSQLCCWYFFHEFIL